MSSVHIRRQSGAAIMTIPAELLKRLNVGVGETLELEVIEGSLVARPAQRPTQRRYALAQLLEGITPVVARQMAAQSTQWHTGVPVRRELT